ncbi:MAG: hypothetical protein OEV44_11700 [Spirochaetota bacterium]|nr:hypothetical protein [Spirochaetota bacterium]
MISILIISALKEEVKYFISKIKGREKSKIGSGELYKGFLHGKHIYLLITGIGSENIKLNLNQFPYKDKLTFILSIGISGGLSEELCFNDLVIQDTILSFDGNKSISSITISNNLIHKVTNILSNHNIPFHTKKSLTTNEIVRSIEAKNNLLQFDASLIDMETYTIAEIARSNNLEILSLRVILDTYMDILPDFSRFTNDFGKLKIISLIHQILKDYNLIIKLIKIASKMKIVKAKISSVLDLLLKELVV